MTKAVQISDKAHAILKEAAFNRQTSMAKLIHKMLQNLEVNAKQIDDYQYLSQVIEKLDTLLEQTKPKASVKKNVVKVEYDCSFQQKLIDYRKEIKKPIKTKRGLNQLVSAIEECAKAWMVTREQVLDYMMRKEWQSVKPDYDNPYTIHSPVFKGVNNQSIDDVLG